MLVAKTVCVKTFNNSTDLKYREVGIVSCVVLDLTELCGNDRLTDSLDIGVGSVYKLDVVFEEQLLEQIPKEKRQPLIDCLADDPRPSYQDDEDRIYRMCFAEFDVGFKVSKNVLTVFDIK